MSTPRQRAAGRSTKAKGGYPHVVLLPRPVLRSNPVGEWHAPAKRFGVGPQARHGHASVDHATPPPADTLPDAALAR